MPSKVFLIVLLLVAALGVLASPDQSTVPASPTNVCAWVERFHIMDRPTRITLSDLDWVDHVAGVPPPFRSAVEETLKNGDITTTAQLARIEFKGPLGRVLRLPGPAQTMIRVFFALAGDPPCNVTNSSGTQSPSQPQQSNESNLDARLLTIQQSIDELNQKVDQARAQLAGVQDELSGARKSTQIGILVGLVGVAVALMFILKVFG